MLDPGTKFDFFLYTPESDVTQSWRFLATEEINGLTSDTLLASNAANTSGFEFSFKDLNNNPITTFGTTSGWTNWSVSTERNGTSAPTLVPLRSYAA